MQDIETRKLTRARIVVHIERKVVDFINERREEENDLLYDVGSDDKTKAEDNKLTVTVKNKDGVLEIQVRSEVDEEKSLSSETANQVGNTRNLTLVLKSQAPPIAPGNTPRPSRILVLQERSQKANDVQ